MSLGRVMALDVGEKTVGVALSDPDRILASGLKTVRRTKLDADLAAIEAVFRAEEVTTVVVGWPLRLDGRETQQTRNVARFADALAARLGQPVERFDERLSTVAAERALLSGNVRREKRREVVDMVAATWILQAWLDLAKNTAKAAERT